jgi:hypothetical protein
MGIQLFPLQPIRVLIAALDTVMIGTHAFEGVQIPEPSTPIALMPGFMIRYRCRSDSALALAHCAQRIFLKLFQPQPQPALGLVQALTFSRSCRRRYRRRGDPLLSRWQPRRQPGKLTHRTRSLGGQTLSMRGLQGIKQHHSTATPRLRFHIEGEQL